MCVCVCVCVCKGVQVEKIAAETERTEVERRALQQQIHDVSHGLSVLHVCIDVCIATLCLSVLYACIDVYMLSNLSVCMYRCMHSHCPSLCCMYV